MFKMRSGFTLPEVLMTIALMSFIALGVIPLLGKDLATLQRDDKLKEFHGIIQCYYDENGRLRQFVWDYSNKAHNDSGGVETFPANGECRISIPDVNWYKIDLIGAGTRGYGYDEDTETQLLRLRDIYSKMEYRGTLDTSGNPEYYGQDIYSSDTGGVKISRYNGTNRDDYNIIKLDDEFHSRFDKLPQSVQDAWADVEDRNGNKGPLVEYEIRPASGRDVEKDPNFWCTKLLTGTRPLEDREYQRGNPYRMGMISFVVPPANGSNPQLSFNYNTNFLGRNSTGLLDVKDSIIRITNNANNVAGWLNKNFFVTARYPGKAPCNGTWTNGNICPNWTDWFGSYTCADGDIAEVKVHTDNDNSTSGFRHLYDSNVNTMGSDILKRFSAKEDPELQTSAKFLSSSDTLNWAETRTRGRHYLGFPGAPSIDSKCGTNYSSELPPCFLFDHQKVEISPAVGKRGEDGAIYKKIYPKINAHELVLIPGKTDGERSEVRVVKNEGDNKDGELLVRTAYKGDPFNNVTFGSPTASPTVPFKPLTNENTVNSRLSMFDLNKIRTDMRSLMNTSIVNSVQPETQFFEAYEGAEKKSSRGMYAYFNASEKRMYDFGPGRGGHGAQPHIGSINGVINPLEINVDVRVRIRDSESEKTATVQEYVPPILSECLIDSDGITSQIVGENPKHRYCNAHTGYGGAVVVTW